VIINFSKLNWVWTLDQCQAVTQKQETEPSPQLSGRFLVRFIIMVLKRMEDPILKNNNGLKK
jgi:hypothetical protein